MQAALSKKLSFVITLVCTGCYSEHLAVTQFV